MDLRVLIISKLCSEILYEATVPWDSQNYILTLVNLIDVIYDTFKLHPSQFSLYWSYSRSSVLKINDYISFITAVQLADPYIYILLHDYDEPWEDNLNYLVVLDYLDDKARKEKTRSLYDVKIKRTDSETEDAYLLETAKDDQRVKRRDSEVISFALRKEPYRYCTTTDCGRRKLLVAGIKKATASLLCFANILGMKGDIISCPHKDIYFLETNTKSETTDLANLFAPPAGREMAKYKPRTKLKHKHNPALEFFIQSKAEATRQETKMQEEGKSTTGGNQSSRRNSIDLYEEAATILGLTCAQTDDCKCIECQCHYFDFEEEMDFPSAGGECVVDHTSSCSIQ